METNNFALHNGKIVYVPDVPEIPSLLDCQNIHFGKPDSDSGRMLQKLAYKQALQSAISKGIEVENQKEVRDQINPFGAIGDIKENTLYPLNCKVEVIEEWIPGQGYNSPSKEIARVTFEQPEIKRVCNHDALIDTGVGYDVCPICNSSFPHIEPEAAGQEQEAVDHANRILFSNLKYQIGNIFTEKFLEHNDGKFHTALELNPAIHAVTEFVFEKIKQQKP